MKIYRVELIPVFSFLCLFITVLIGGIYYPNYNHFSQYISELGAYNAPNNLFINFGLVFTDIILLVYFFLFLREKKLNNQAKFGIYAFICYCILLIVAAIFPIEYEFSNEVNSLSQEIHTVSGVLAYLFGIVAVSLLTFEFGKNKKYRTILNVGIGVVIISTISYLFLLTDVEYDGLVQRILEVSIYLWLFIFSFTVKKDIAKYV